MFGHIWAPKHPEDFLLAVLLVACHSQGWIQEDGVPLGVASHTDG